MSKSGPIVETWDEAVLAADVPAMTKLVCYTIGVHIRKHGFAAFPSVATIAKGAKITRRAATTHVKKAVDASLLTLENRRDDKGALTSNLYRICFPDHMNVPRKQVVAGESEQNAMNGKGGREPGSLGTEAGSVGVGNQVPTIEERKKDNNIIGRANALPDTTQKPTAPKAKRGTRLPDDFIVPADWREQALREHPNLDIDAQALRFTRYWQSAGGQKACKVNWRLAWLNWCDSPLNQPKRTFEPSHAEKVADYKRRIALL